MAGALEGPLADEPRVRAVVLGVAGAAGGGLRELEGAVEARALLDLERDLGVAGAAGVGELAAAVAVALLATVGRRELGHAGVGRVERAGGGALGVVRDDGEHDADRREREPEARVEEAPHPTPPKRSAVQTWIATSRTRSSATQRWK